MEKLQRETQGGFDSYLSLGAQRRAAVDLGAEAGGRLRHPRRPAGLVAALRGRPGGVFQGAIPSRQKKTNHSIVRYESEYIRNHKGRQDKLTLPSSTLPGAVAAGIQLEKMHFVQGEHAQNRGEIAASLLMLNARGGEKRENFRFGRLLLQIE